MQRERERCLRASVIAREVRGMLGELEAWGVLPIVVPFLVWNSWCIASKLFPTEGLTVRAPATVIVAMALVQGSVELLGHLGLVTLSMLLLVQAALLVAVGRHPPPSLAPGTWRRALGANPVALAIVVGVSLVAALTARLLPVWQWDSLGYHLPFVNLVLQHHGFADVPRDLRYVSTYPHNIELGMVWLRSFLPDDRLVDLAQLPYGLAGGVVTAALARTFGASVRMAWWALAAWLTVPVVFLQLPTNYVDVGTAAAFLGALFFLVFRPAHWRDLLVGGLALGCFLGSKPSAPLAAVGLALVALVRSTRAKTLPAFALAMLVTLPFGAKMYATMWLRHGNPVWPVAVKLGPLSLPGELPVSQLLAAGAALPSASGSVIERLLVSWLAVDVAPAFDMKLGGLGLLFLVAIPLAVVALVRRRAWAALVALGLALLSPDPSLGRYVMAFAALVVALAVTQVPRGWERPVSVVIVALMAWQLHHAWPGLTGDGPSWAMYLSMNDDERRVAVGPHGRPTDYPPTWDRVGRGASVAFDVEFEFPGLLWSPELRYPVHALPSQASAEALEQFLDERHVEVVAVGGPHQAWFEHAPGWTRLFDCRSTSCVVFARATTLVAR